MKTEIFMQWQTVVEMIPLPWNKQVRIIKNKSLGFILRMKPKLF